MSTEDLKETIGKAAVDLVEKVVGAVQKPMAGEIWSSYTDVVEGNTLTPLVFDAIEEAEIEQFESDVDDLVDTNEMVGMVLDKFITIAIPLIKTAFAGGVG